MHGYNVECEERVVGDFLPSTEMEKTKPIQIFDDDDGEDHLPGWRPHLLLPADIDARELGDKSIASLASCYHHRRRGQLEKLKYLKPCHSEAAIIFPSRFTIKINA